MSARAKTAAVAGAGAAAAAGVAIYAGQYPTAQIYGPTICRNPEAGRRIALTYDDGPNPVYTPPLLALLGPGIMTVAGGTEPVRRLFIDGGFCDVSPAGCTVLAEAAYQPDEVGRIDEMIAAAEQSAATLSGDALDQANLRLATLRTVRAGF